MSFLIKGMNMPKEGGVIVVYKEGNSFYTTKAGEGKRYPLVEVPTPHGKLIDLDYADEYAYDELEVANSYITGWEAARSMQKIYQAAPIVIEAEE